MTLQDLLQRLRRGGPVLLAVGEWESVEGDFREVERRATGFAGDLVVARRGETVVAIEEPEPDGRVVRVLEDLEAARRFVEDRMETYERMWDGCGCRIDYNA